MFFLIFESFDYPPPDSILCLPEIMQELLICSTLICVSQFHVEEGKKPTECNSEFGIYK